MGYQTDFDGQLTLNKQLSLDDYQWLKNFNDERHEETKYPGLYCQWIPTEDGKHIEWDGNEKFYDYVEWMKWLIENFFTPKGYVLNGKIDWEGEEQGDVGKIIVKDNVVTTKNAKLVYET